MKVGGAVMTESWKYNQLLQPTETWMKLETNQANLLKLEYFYCYGYGTTCTANNGNMLTQRISHGALPGEASWTTTQAYRYDRMDRLTSFTEGPVEALRCLGRLLKMGE